MPVRGTPVRAQDEFDLTVLRALALMALALGQPLHGQDDTSGRADSIRVRFSYGGSAWVLSNLNGYADPFYHASGLLHVVVTAHVGDNVQVPMRLLSEAWNFSQLYQAPTMTQLRPAIRLAVRGSRLGDSLALLAGDLWRVRHGEGLLLDDFESRGATLRVFTGRWALTGELIGSGWTGGDDLRIASLEFANRVAVRWFHDLPDFSAVYVGSRIISADARIPVLSVGGLYGEVARNLDARGWSGLVGLRTRFATGPHRLSASLEYRNYDRNFFRNDDNANAVYFYFSSLTALDKPIHSFQLYQHRRGRHEVLAARVRARGYLGPWFANTDLEAIGGTVQEFAYEGSVGMGVNRWVDLQVGLLNKLFQFPASGGDMFLLRDNPLVFMKVTIDLADERR